jgi:FHA domain
MRITSCVPLPGQGLIARHGALVAVTGARGEGGDPLLDVLAEVAAAPGDGSELVRTAARAALGCAGQPAWACAGVTADGAVAVLVHGHAVATVRISGAPALTLTANDSVIPVSRTFSAATVDLDLVIGDPAAPDPRCWLGRGVVPGAGLAVTVAAGVDVPRDGGPAGQPAAEAAADYEADHEADRPHPVLLDGVRCVRAHFNDPAARACRQCGASIDRQPGSFQRRPRPPLGELVLDDGTRIALDGDYVLGREPVLDGEVIAGRARPLRITDPEGTISRAHLRISLVGWQVEISDLGSANGSFLQSPGGQHALAPFEPTVVEPGAWIGIGQRSMQYLAYQGVLP